MCVSGRSAAAPCDWAVMVGLMPAPAVDGVRRRPSPNARPTGVRVAAPVGSPWKHANDGGRALSHWLSNIKSHQSHNTARRDTSTRGQNPPQGGAANAHRRGAQHTTPEPTAIRGGQQTPTAQGGTSPEPTTGGGSKRPPQGGTTPQGGGPPGGHNTAGGTAHKRAAPTRQQCVCVWCVYDGACLTLFLFHTLYTYFQSPVPHIFIVILVTRSN